MKSPIEKQIRLVDNMTHILNISFPNSSREFNRYTYSCWIVSHIDDYKDILSNTICDEDYIAEICINDVWCEEY